MDATFEDLSAPCSSTSTSSASSSASQIPVADSDDERAYFVPYRWWKEAHKSSSRDSDVKGVVYLASSTSSYPNPMKIINNIFNSDLAFNMRREEVSNQNNESSEVGVSGRDFALVSGQMWLQALKWHSDSRYAMKQSDPKSGSMHRRSFSAAEDDMADVYPLQLRLTVLRDISTLGVKISKKDNAVELFRRSCKIFNVDYDQLRIWDFSGQINQFFSNEKNKLSRDSHRQSDLEILLELQVYGLSDSMKCNNGKKDEVALQQHNLARSSSVSSFMMNGCSGNVAATLSQTNTTSFYGSFSESGSLGLTGLQNLGNTCFMNSALQCLVHTPKLVDYFLGDYNREINHDNPLGMDGEIALAFGDLLRKLWAPGATPVPPKIFKSKLARFAPQFSGFNQHDSQELLAFLLDGLHEDLNRVKCKPYVEVKDGEDRPDEDVADEYWQNHLARNDSIIVDVCQGQYRSTLVCPDCKKVSVTFDPFMYLSLPLPSTTMRTMTLTIMSTDGSIMPAPFTVTVPKSGKFEDLIQALSSACSLGVDEMLLVAEIYNNRIIRFLDDPSDSLSLIRDDDQLVAYRLAKDVDKAPLIVFMHQRMEEQRLYGKMAPGWKAFGIPLVARLCTDVNGSDISSLYLDLLKPFLIPKEDVVDICDRLASTTVEEVTEKGDPENLVLDGDTGAQVDGNDSGSQSETNVLFHLTDEKGIHKNSQILMNEPVFITGSAERLNVLACWPENQIKNYNVQLLNSLPEVFKSSFFAKKPQESVSLYKCLEAFLKEEPLGPEDMWYCPGCKTHRQASKKLDLWRLPEILVIHLKRFSYSRYTKNKLETFVDFPIDNLDLSTYVAYQNGESSKRYMLYAVSNHFGNMGGGHYTAFVHQGGGRWYDFDDSRVYPVNEDKIKSSAAYVLFYRRIDDA